MSSSRTLLRTWSGPVDAAAVRVSALLSAGQVRVGGRQHLERLERVHGRVLLQVVSGSSMQVTVSRQLSNRKVRSYALFDDRFGLQMGLLLRSFRSLGARESLLIHLAGAAAACGSADVALSGLQAVRQLVGGGVNLWMEDLTRLLRREPHLLRLLPLLEGADAAGLRPSSLASALSTAQLLDRSRHAAAAAGLAADPQSDVRLEDAAPTSTLFSGFELVLCPSSSRTLPPLLRSAALLGPARLEDRAQELVVVALPSVEDLPDLVRRLVREMRWMLLPQELPGLMGVGVPGAGLRFVWPVEFGLLPASSLHLLRAPAAGPAADAAEDLRRQAEDRRVDLQLLASQLSAAGVPLARMPANLMLRLLRLAEEGFLPGSVEWEALLGQVPQR